MTNHSNIESLRHSHVFGSDGEKIGKVGEVYLDDQTGEPTFATVNTGLFGTKETFVPLDRAQTTEDGITVPYTKEFVKDAPNIDDDGSLSPEEEQRIYEYYSMNHSGDADARGTRDRDAAAGTAAGTAATDDRAAAARDGHTADERLAAERNGNAVQDDRRAAGAENDVVAHEEHLRATGKAERRQTGGVRLRKHVVTDTETVEVPVRREEVHVEREKIDPDSPEARAAAKGAFTGDGEETVVTTFEERPVVTTETVATERVSLNKEATEHTEQVTGEVRKEEIEIDEQGNRKPRP